MFILRDYNKDTHWLPAPFAPTVLPPTSTFYITCCNISINNSTQLIQKQRRAINNHATYNYYDHAWQQKIRDTVDNGNQYRNWTHHPHSTFILQLMWNDLPTPSIQAHRCNNLSFTTAGIWMPGEGKWNETQE